MTSTKLRVLSILPDLRGGGAERTTPNLCNHLDPARFEIEVALLEAKGEFLSELATGWIAPPEGFLRRMARRFPPDSLGRALPQILLLRWLVKTRRPDVVMTNMPDVSIPMALAWNSLPRLRRRTRWIARDGNNTPLVFQLQLPPLWRRTVERAIAHAYRRTDAVIVTSAALADSMAGRYGVARRHFAVIGNPVDLTVIADAARQPPAIALPTRFIVAIGRLARQKGFDLLLRAFADLEKPDLHLVVLGTGPEENALRELAQSLGVTDRFHLPGFLANPWAVMARAQAFCLSSRWEGFGHVIVEAMACGVPVVATACPHGPSEILRAGADGILVAPDDWCALKDGIARTLNEPVATARRVESARLRAEDFDATKIARAYGALFGAD